MDREEYIKRAWNNVAIKVGSAIESGNKNMWNLIDDYIKAGIEEAYDKGHADGYRGGYSEGYDDGAADQYND